MNQKGEERARIISLSHYICCMKKLILLLILITWAAAYSFGQLRLHQPERMPDLKLSQPTATNSISSLWSSPGYFAAVRGTETLVGTDSLFVFSAEIGYGITFSDEEIEQFGLYGSWNYSALPFISLEYHSYFKTDDLSYVSYKEVAPPVMLHVGVTGGTGVLFFFLPFGINGTTGLSTDFQNLFIRYGIAYDAFGFSIGYTGFIRLTKNGQNPGYLSIPALELRLFLY